MSKVAKHLQKPAIIAKIVPSAQRLVADTSEFVRAFFANEVNLLAPLLGTDDTVQYLLPLLLQLLRDETSEVCI
jgi:serine/threonine-protein phosphatase 2A regulatory subunit A